MANLRQLISRDRAQRTPLVGAAAGSGAVVKSAVSADADLLLALTASLYRNMGWGTLSACFLPYGDSNKQTRQILAQHVLPHSKDVPIVAGIFGDEDEKIDAHIAWLKEAGVQGVTNWPAIGLLDGNFREMLAAEGFTIDWEIQTLKRAQAAGLATFGFVCTPEEARRFADSGVDALILCLGVTRRYEDFHERRDQLQHAITRLNQMRNALGTAGKKLLCLAYGGPVTMPEDLEQVFRFCDVDGFAGGSVFERLPVSDIVGSMVRRFKSIATDPEERVGEMGLGQMIGRSGPMKELFALIKRIAPYDVNVVIEGESGTGKELVATQIHRLSKRAAQAFVTLNCGAIPDTLLESELFGHEKGAFTGADRRRLGKFELAHRGTLFLDEIANLSPHGQVALLRAIQQREITRVGAENYIPTDVRVVVASNQPLAALVQQGKFRADLYHRLRQVTLSLPPLRERREDLPLLADDILARVQIQLGRKMLSIGSGFLHKMRQHEFSGNIRELQHVILDAVLREDGPVMHGAHFVPMRQSLSVSSNGDGSALTAMTKNLHEARQSAVRQALQEARGNKSRAAEALGITRKTLYAWMRGNAS